ncbi:accessory Sec system S-layer assembly protein [Planococcus salinus]|uniref:Accessory Sec system S-layer assembly protein n=1 Tax=Planococcus salinus TaxID=1848460 RepID=A0A3M8P3D3_9BACL|nr:accessory Sec system S-layer assembly protein [Planococcus salinus]RNF38202.1 accessory Sec system S-layer assembly protein [Planococcus salinus]
MNLFSFFKNATKTGTDTAVSSTELLDGTNEESQDKNEVVTELSIASDWKVSKEQEYVLKFLSNDLPPLKADQLSLSGIQIDVDKGKGDWNVQAFFRSSLDRPIKLGKAELMLLDATNDVVGSQEFDLSELGTLPPFSNRPWVFKFKKENLKSTEVPTDQWSLAFNVQSLVPHSLDLDPAWEEALPKDQKLSLKELVKNLPALKPREVNITGFQSKFTEEGNLAISVFIRNGHTKQIQLEKLPLEVLDAKGEQVVKGSFKLDNLMIKANTSKPWTFIFPREMLTNETPDLSRWTARVPQ